MERGLFLPFQDRCRNKEVKDFPSQDFYFILAEEEIYISINDNISEGQLLTANPKQYIFSHSPVAGIIKDIQLYHHKQYIVIKRDPAISQKIYELKSPLGLTIDQFVEKICQAGVNGLEDGYPLHLKIQKAYEKVHTIVINGIDSEPFIAGKSCILIEKIKELLKTVYQIKTILKANHIIIAICQDKFLRELIEQSIYDKSIKVVELPQKYPLSHERLLVKKIFNKEISKFKLCSEEGIIVFNTTILQAIHDVLFYHKPVMDRIITVDGAYSLEYGNFRVKIGTPIFAFMRPFSVENSYVMFSGGPIIGKELEKEKSVSKNMNALMIFEGQASVSEDYCVFCALCVNICPIGLEPFKLIDFVRHQEYDRAENSQIQECINCNLCSYICPSFIPLAHIIKEGQEKILGNHYAENF